jgi:hypothetical protein
MKHCSYHCSAATGGCGGHFASLEAFDHHRGGDPADRACSWLELPAGWRWVKHVGICKVADPTEPQIDVTIYSLARPGTYAAGDNHEAGVETSEGAEVGARSAVTEAVAA